MVVTWFGRVELDPMRVPVAAAMDRGRRESFAERLDACSREVEATVPEPVRDAESAVPAPTAPDEPAAPAADGSEEPAAPEAPARSDQPAAAPAAATAEPALPARTTATTTAAPGENQAAAGKPGLAALSPTLPLGGADATGQPDVAAAPAAALAAATAPPTVRTAADRVSAAEAIAAARTVAPKAAAAGYRTLTPQALQLDAQARDSVFKQILFRLHKDGGEMRLKLDPPELGELDLHLTVEKGNTLRLSIGTDRADLRDLLLSGLRELENELRQSGLTIAHAEVHARSEHGRHDATPWPQSLPAPGGDDGADAAPRARAGWFTAEGLDFWV